MTTTLVSCHALQAAAMLTGTGVPTFYMKDFQDLDKTRLAFAKSAGVAAKTARIFSASHPFQMNEDSAIATISEAETNLPQIALAYSVHFGEKIANT